MDIIKDLRKQKPVARVKPAALRPVNTEKAVEPQMNTDKHRLGKTRGCLFLSVSIWVNLSLLPLWIHRIYRIIFFSEGAAAIHPNHSFSE
jgi:hypothetical protein